jgi:hypothetical protein
VPWCFFLCLYLSRQLRLRSMASEASRPTAETPAEQNIPIGVVHLSVETRPNIGRKSSTTLLCQGLKAAT